MSSPEIQCIMALRMKMVSYAWTIGRAYGGEEAVKSVDLICDF